MGFNISIYNGYTNNINNMVNSIKASYLYSDDVTLYDNLFILSQYLKVYKNSNKTIPFDFINNCVEDIKEYIDSSDCDLDEIIDAIDMAIVEILQEEYCGYFKCNSNDLINSEVFKLVSIYKPQYKNNQHADEIIKNAKVQFLNSSDFAMINDKQEFPNSYNFRSNTAKFNAVSLASEMFAQMPTFDQASVDEIVDIKKELNKYIIPFRSAIITLSKDINNISSHEELSAACQQIYHNKIAPQIQEIKQATIDNNILKNIVGNTLTSKEFWAGVGALTVAIARGNDILSSITYAGAISFVGTSISNSVKEVKDQVNKIKSNELYFYYEADRKLKK